MPIDFQGKTVVSFESRKAAEMAQLIEGCGGAPVLAPTMRELPNQDQSEALALAERLLAGSVDVLILLTGVGTRMLIDAMSQAHPREQVLKAMGAVTIVARGPKPVAALREVGLSPTITVPEPNTWRDLVTTLTTAMPLAGKTIAIQEYGIRNDKLAEALREQGAQVQSVSVYAWGLPEDLAPLRAAIDAIIEGRVDIALFTSATQVHHLFKVASEGGQADALRDAMRRVCIGSVGPIASEHLTELGLTPDYEPDAPHMPQLVRELARRGGDLLQKKRVGASCGVNTNAWRRIDMRWAAPGKPPAHDLPTRDESVFLKACRREPTPYTPIWIMRQAGRYQRAYREIRARTTMLELCKTPELAAEVTLMAVDRLGVDAAIIFADILLLVEPLGLHLEFAKGEGPIIHNPVRSKTDVERLAAGDAREAGYVSEAIALTRQSLRPDIALIGFAGAPFTVASYIVEGGKSKMYENAKTMMAADETAWHGLMDRLSAITADYLIHQIDAGADAVQLFDSWVGALSPDQYRQYVMPHSSAIIEAVKAAHPQAPVIHFGTGNPALLPLMKQAGGDVIGLDWRVDLADAWRTLGDDVAVMGNLDPTVLYAPPKVIRQAAQAVLDKAAGRPGHIFNLGHGVSPDMNPLHVAELVDAVHELSARGPSAWPIAGAPASSRP